ncbi:type II secretion system protein [Ralstonia pickettii]|nr:type II secretion system protein [Ralstonia pickettii]MBA9853997.1 type II secretion system protein [Ralstonia pickettii]MBA9921629.1 type II secretion system protein [Ralstonia pickettii]MBA9960656.1 type II secretion system protein [Ralstonia pickettii]MBA9966091.1 type II secretion system protein [Ralstonia pickettii]
MRGRQRGVGYLFMLFAVFLLSLGLGKAVEVYSTSMQREREAALLEVGAAYRQAIKDYYLSAPNGQHRYPAQLEDLLKDNRHLVTRRYLRRLYLDPMTSQPFVPVLAPQGGIWGVASTSTKLPIRTKLPAEVMIRNSLARTYADWLFMYDGCPTP